MLRNFRGWIGRAARTRSQARRPLAAYHRIGRALEYLEDRSVPALISYSGGPYTQNFDALPTSTSGTLVGNGPFFLDADAPTNGTQNLNFGLTGWQIFKTGGSGGNAVFLVHSGANSQNTGAAYSYGVEGTNPVGERALGQVASGTTISTFGATFQNTGTTTYTGFTLAFTAEQWRQGSTTADVQKFEYLVGPASGAGAVTNINIGAAPPANANGDLVTINTTAANDTALDGNLAANRQAKSVTVTGISWAPGQNLSIRWNDSNVTGSDDGLGVDDLTFTGTTGGADTPPDITSRNNTFITEGVAGQTFAVAAAGSPAPTAYSLTTASGQTGPPAGTTISDTGVISFPTPPAPAGHQTETFTFTVNATNTEGTDSQAFTLYLVPAAKPATPLAPGNLLVYRLGDGGQTYGSQGSNPTPTVGSSGHAVFLDEYTPAGVYVQTVFVPTTGAGRLVGSLAAASDGLLTLSADGRLAAFTGYRADVGTANVVGTASGTTPRVVRLVHPDGTLGASAASSTAFDGNNIRGGATVDGRQFYAAGTSTPAANGGVRYFDTPGAADAAGTRVTNTTNVRGVSVVDGQVYFSTGSGPGDPAFNAGRGVYQPNGLPLPTTAPADPVDAGLQAAAGSPYQYAVLDMNGNAALDAGDRLYFTDDRAAASGGGVYRADYGGTAFGSPVQVLAAPVPDLRGLTGAVNGPTSATLYLTSAANSFGAATTFSTALHTLTDANPAPAADVALTTLLTKSDGGVTDAAPVQQFRGIAVVPRRAGLNGDVATALALTAAPAAVPAGETTTLTAAVTRTGTTGFTPDGYVTFVEAATGRALHTTRLDAAGRATFTFAPPGVTDYPVEAYYSGTDTFLAASGSATVAISGGFTAGNIVVVRVGTGAGSITSTTTGVATFLDEFTPAGAATVSVPLPTASAVAAVSAASQSGAVVTVTTDAPHGFLFGQPVTVAGVTPAGYNGTFTITGVPSATQFTYVATAGLAAGTGGTAAVVTNALTITGAAAEGALLRSLDGQTLSLAGYRQTPGGAVASANRQVAVVRPNGAVDLSTQLPAGDGFVRAAASADGRGFFLATSAGVRYVPFGNGPTPGVTIDTATASGPTATITTAAAHGLAVGQTVVVAGVGVAGYNGTFVVASAPTATTFTYVNTVNNLAASGGGSTVGVPSSVRLSNYYNSITSVSISPQGQLYLILGTGASAATGVPAIDGPAPVGVGLPTAGGQTADPLFGFPTAQDSGSPASFPIPNQFVFSPTGDTVYLADGRTNGNGGLYKYEFSGGQWVETASHLFPVVGGVAGTGTGLRGLAVDFSGGSPVVYATTAEASANRILKFTDSGFGFGAPATLATAPANTAYRGVSLAPVAAGTTATTTALTVAPAAAAYGAGVTLTATVARASGPGATPAGVVSFRTAGGREIGVGVLNASGVATLDTDANLGVFGSPHTVTAVYTGDPTYAGSTSAAVSASITPDATSVTLTVSPNPVGAGTNTTLTAALGSIPAGTAPIGTVTFYDGATALGTVQPVAQVIVPDGTGNPVITFRASVIVSFADTGTKSLTAVYSGETNFDGSTSAAVNLQVVAAAAVTVGSSNTGTAPVGPTLTFTATVAPASGTGPTPTGTVQFFDNLLPLGGPVTLAGGAATRAVPTALLQAAGSLTPGLHSIRAVYTPDAASSGLYFTGTGLRTQAVQVQAFGPGNPLVERVGDGTAAINTATGTPVYVDEYTAAGTLVQSIAFPAFPDLTGGNTVHALVTQAQQSGTGALSLAGDGRSVFLAGFDSAPLAGGDVRTAAGVGRTVGRIAADGTVSTGVALSDVAVGGNVNGVYSPDGNSFYITGAAGGVRYVSSYTPQAALQTSTQVATSSNTLLDLTVAGGQLYVSSNNNATLKVGAVGTGTPTNTGNTITQIPGIPQGTGVVPKFPVGVYFTHLDGDGAPAGINTLYLAENGTGFAGGTLTKWALSAGASPTWSNVGTITADVTNVVSFYWLSGQTSAGTTTLYSTYGSGGGSSTGPGQLLRVTDANGYGQPFSSTAVDRVAETGGTSNRTFRGVARAPQDLTSSLASSANPGPSGQPVTLTFSVGGGPDAPTGTVYFYDGTTPLGSAAVDGSGQATFVTAPLVLGTAYNFSATYTGDSDHNPVTRTLTQTVTEGTTVQFTAAQFDAVADPGVVNLTVTRTGGTAAVTVTAFTTAGTAADGVDFTAIPAATPFVVSFAENQTTAVVPVTLLDGGATYAGARTFTVTLADNGGGAVPGTQGATTVSITDPVLQVTGTPAVAGSTLTLAFNRKVDPVPVNLYDNAAGAFGPADLQVVDGTTGAVVGAVRGSLVFDPTANTASFVNTAGSLPTSGTYRVRLASGATAFRGLDGRALDGDADGTAGGDYLSAELTTPAGPTVGVRGFARAAGQPVNVPANGPGGLPVTIRGAANVTQVGFTLTYDPTLLTIAPTGALTLSAGAAGAGLALAAYTITPVGPRQSVLAASASGGTGWNPADGATLLTVAAEVPAGAPYQAKQVLDVGAVTVNNAAGVGADGVHAAALVGDVSGDGRYTSLDAGQLTQAAIGLASGFGGYNNLDPVVVGGVSGGGAVSSLDSGLVVRFAVGLPTPLIPTIPITAPPPAAGPDPRYYLETVSAGRGQTVTVRVRVEVTEEGGIDLFSLDTAIRFDPRVLSVSNVRGGDGLLALQSAFATTPNAQNDLGQLRVGQVSNSGVGTPTIPKGTDLDVIAFDVTVADDAPFGLTRLNLVPRIDNSLTSLSNGAFETLTLVPAPTDADDQAGVDGGVSVVPPSGALFVPDVNASTGETVTVPVQFRNGPVPVALFAFDLALLYDPAELELVSAERGSFVAANPPFNFTPNPDPAGTLRIGSSTSDGLSRTIAPGAVVELASLTFTVRSAGGSTFINLASEYPPTRTAVFQEDGAIDLDPDPTDAPGGDEDGLVTVVIRPNQPPTAAVRDTVNFAPGQVLFNPAAADGLRTATPNVFAFTGGDEIRVGDPDAGAGLLTVVLTATGGGTSPAPVGVLAAAASGGATVTPSAGGTVLTLVGTVADLNATLASLTYTPGPGYSGRTTVTVAVDDGGNSGFGGPLTTTKSTAVDVVGLYVSEVMLRRSNAAGVLQAPAPDQYVEVFSTVPNYTIPAGVYLVGVEGDNNNPANALNNPGLVQDVFALGGFTTGPNGYLALLQRNQPYVGAGAVPTLPDGTTPLGAVVANAPTATGAGNVGFGNGGGASRFVQGTTVLTGVHVGQLTPSTAARVGTTPAENQTDVEQGAASYLLIQAPAAPTTAVDIDTTGNDGTPDGAVYAGWNVLDGVALLDAVNGAAATPDRTYAPVAFRPTASTGTALGGVISTGTFVPTYAGRVGRNLGYSAADWLASVPTADAAGGLLYLLDPARSTQFGGQALNHVGAPNFFAPRATVATNDGVSAQRSQVSFLTVQFSQPVTVADPAAFAVATAGGTALDVTAYTDLPGLGGLPVAAGDVVGAVFLVPNAGSPATFAYAGPDPFGNTVGLANGNYLVTVDAARVSSNGVALDGDGDGVGGDSLREQVFRLYGDVNGDRRVDGADNARFRAAYTAAPLDPADADAFDANVDTVLDGVDLAAFRVARGTSLPPA